MRRFSLWLLAITAAVCALPSLLNLMGVDFGLTHALPGAVEAPSMVVHNRSGELSHTLIEWSAVIMALFTAVAAMVHFRVTGSLVSPVIGFALFWTGVLDAFHAISGNYQQFSTVADVNFEPFTWTISRLFQAAIPLTGAMILLMRRKGPRVRRGLPVVGLMGVGFGAAALMLVGYLASSGRLPNTTFPGHWVKRPFDIAPLLLYALGGAVVYKKLYARYRTLGTAALWISTIPGIVSQAHVAFSSRELYDNHFMIAHGLKLLCYLVPLAGLMYDLVLADHTRVRVVAKLKWAHAALFERNGELMALNRELRAKNEELDEFTYVASHDLQEPLRKLLTFGDLLVKDLGGELPERAARDLHHIRDAAARMRTLVRDLLQLSRSINSEMSKRRVSLADCVDRAIAALDISVAECGAKIEKGGLPDVEGDLTLLTQLYQNLIGNALKFRGEAAPEVALTAQRAGKEWVFGVRDNGIGVEPEFAKQVFAPFKRLQSRAKYEGTGIGLAICEKTVKRHGGRIWVEPAEPHGSHFKFTLGDVVEAETT
ncbi:MAG TPA: ATP-binding protein [Planctomycetota bacterium]